MDRAVLAQKFRGALIGGAVGDGLGAPFEGRPAVGWAELAGLEDSPGPLRYTDDTNMTLGLAASLVEQKGFDGPHMAALLALNFAAEPWRGYGATPPLVFRLLEQGVPWDQASSRAFGGQGSFGNGAAMRVAPAALLGFPDLEKVKSLARSTAIITHAHELGVEGAVLQACAVAQALAADPATDLAPSAFLEHLHQNMSHSVYRRKMDEMGRLLARGEECDQSTVVALLGNGIAAHESVPTAIYAFLRYPTSFSHAVKYAIGLGGDTDTIACMAGALSGSFLGITAIPETWWERVEGAVELRQLADALLGLVSGGEAH